MVHDFESLYAVHYTSLTTQLYFPDGADNRRDSIFDPALVMRVRDVEGGKVATFDFVIAGR